MINQNKIKPGQIWIDKKDGKLLFIGKKADGTRWNVTDSISRRCHKTPFMEILSRCELYTEDSGELEVGTERYVIARATNATFKAKPKLLPRFVHKWLINQLIDIHDIRIKRLEKDGLEPIKRDK